MKRIALLSLALALCACQSNQRDSSPSLLKDGIQLRQKTVAVDAEHAKVIMKASGGTNPVEFAIHREGDPDSRMEKLGTVMDTGEGKVLNWIAKLNQTVASAGFKRFPQLEIQADPGKKLTVSSSAGSDAASSTASASSPASPPTSRPPRWRVWPITRSASSWPPACWPASTRTILRSKA